MNVRYVTAVVLLCVTALVVPGIGLAVGQCNPVDGSNVCVKDMSVSKDILLTGEQANLTITVENTGSEPATIRATLNTAGPNNTTGVYPIAQRTLLPGENQTITQPLNGSEPGIHGFRVLITDAETGEDLDTSEILTIEVREEPPVRLGGPIDRPEFALVALLLSFVGLAGLGYRQYTG